MTVEQVKRWGLTVLAVAALVAAMFFAFGCAATDSWGLTETRQTVDPATGEVYEHRALTPATEATVRGAATTGGAAVGIPGEIIGGLVTFLLGGLYLGTRRVVGVVADKVIAGERAKDALTATVRTIDTFAVKAPDAAAELRAIQAAAMPAPSDPRRALIREIRAA